MELTLFDLVWMPIFIVAVGALIRWIVLKMSVTDPMRGLLKCDDATARMALGYIQERGISWMKFLELFYCAMNRLMPMFASPGQFTATWEETRIATVAILNKRLLMPDTDSEQFVSMVAAEVAASRGGPSEMFRAAFLDGHVSAHPEDQISF